MPISPITNGLSLVDSHENRLQRVEDGIADLGIKVAEIGVKVEFHGKMAQERNDLILEKIEALNKTSEKLKTESKKLLWEFFPVKFARKYFLHILMGVGGIIGHALFEWFNKLK